MDSLKRILIGLSLLFFTIPCYAQPRGGTPAPKWLAVDGSTSARARTIVVSDTAITSVDGSTMSLDIVTGVSADASYLRVDTSNDPLTGTLDMNANPIVNIGDTGTDFSATGGLSLADTLTRSISTTANFCELTFSLDGNTVTGIDFDMNSGTQDTNWTFKGLNFDFGTAQDKPGTTNEYALYIFDSATGDAGDGPHTRYGVYVDLDQALAQGGSAVWDFYGLGTNAYFNEFVRFGTTGSGSQSLGASDVLFGADVEIDGTLYLDGSFGGDITLQNAEKISNSTDDMIDFVGSGGTTDQTLRFDLDDTNGPMITTTTGDRVQVDEMLQVSSSTDTNDIHFLISETTSADTGSSKYFFYLGQNVNPLGADDTYGLNFLVQTSASSGSQTGRMIGVQGVGRLRNNVAVDTIHGAEIKIDSVNTTTGTASDMAAFASYARMGNGTTPTVQNLYGFRSFVFDAEDATVVNGFGMHMVSPHVDTGSLTNYNHIWLNDATVATSNNRGIVIDSDTIGLTLGASQDVTLTGSGNGFDFGDADCLSLAKLEFLDSGLYIDGSANGVLDVVADTTMNIGSTVTTLNVGNTTVTTANVATGASTANFGQAGAVSIGGSGAVSINDAGNDWDTWVEGASDTLLTYWNAGTDRVGISTSSPESPLEVEATSSAIAVQLVTLDQDDADQAFIDFQGTSAASAANNISTWTTGNSIQGFFKIEINGAAYWLPYYDAPTS